MGEHVYRMSRRRQVRFATNGHCFYCDCAVFPPGSAAALEHPDQRATNDHYTPYSLTQGTQEVKIVTACYRCNNVKGETPPFVFETFISKVDTRIGTAALRQKYKHFVYQLAITGLTAAIREARRARAATQEVRAKTAGVIAPRDARGRFTIRDLRKRA